MPVFLPPQDYLSTPNPADALTESTRKEMDKLVLDTPLDNDRLKIAEEDDHLYIRHLALDLLRLENLDQEFSDRLIRIASTATNEWLLYPAFKALPAAAKAGSHVKVQQFLLDSARTASIPNVREYAMVAMADLSAINAGEVRADWQVESVKLFRQLILDEPDNHIRTKVVNRVLSNASLSSTRGLYPDALIEFAEQWLRHTDAEIPHNPYYAPIRGKKIPGYFATTQLLARRINTGGNDTTRETTAKSGAPRTGETQDPIELTVKSIKRQILASNATLAFGLALVGLGLLYSVQVFWIGLLVIVGGGIWRFVVVPAKKWWKQG